MRNSFTEQAEKLLKEIYHVSKTFDKQDESGARKRYYEIISEQLFSISCILNDLRTLAFVFLGFLFAKVISSGLGF